ncbi:hypothetical protein ACFT9M_08850 [Micromonospora purpureochromogenes]|uniref:hypothetical protein n=1 Tax=Micromonospora purpureochromogenes TaxID=47872 RepID=UPI0036337B48
MIMAVLVAGGLTLLSLGGRRRAAAAIVARDFSGHSHGSVLLAATVLQLPPQVRRRVALLTHGSPLDRLYARLFPAYLGKDVLHEVGERVGWRWLNLWRETDPIGGWLFAAHRPGDRRAGPARATGSTGGCGTPRMWWHPRATASRPR